MIRIFLLHVVIKSIIAYRKLVYVATGGIVYQDHILWGIMFDAIEKSSQIKRQKKRLHFAKSNSTDKFIGIEEYDHYDGVMLNCMGYYKGKRSLITLGTWGELTNEDNNPNTKNRNPGGEYWNPCTYRLVYITKLQWTYRLLIESIWWVLCFILGNKRAYKITGPFGHKPIAMMQKNKTVMAYYDHELYSLADLNGVKNV